MALLAVSVASFAFSLIKITWILSSVSGTIQLPQYINQTIGARLNI